MGSSKHGFCLVEFLRPGATKMWKSEKIPWLMDQSHRWVAPSWRPWAGSEFVCCKDNSIKEEVSNGTSCSWHRPGNEGLREDGVTTAGDQEGGYCLAEASQLPMCPQSGTAKVLHRCEQERCVPRENWSCMGCVAEEMREEHLWVQSELCLLSDRKEERVGRKIPPSLKRRRDRHMALCAPKSLHDWLKPHKTNMYLSPQKPFKYLKYLEMLPLSLHTISCGSHPCHSYVLESQFLLQVGFLISTEEWWVMVLPLWCSHNEAAGRTECSGTWSSSICACVLTIQSWALQILAPHKVYFHTFAGPFVYSLPVSVPLKGTLALSSHCGQRRSRYLKEVARYHNSSFDGHIPWLD